MILILFLLGAVNLWFVFNGRRRSLNMISAIACGAAWIIAVALLI